MSRAVVASIFSIQIYENGIWTWYKVITCLICNFWHILATTIHTLRNELFSLIIFFFSSPRKKESGFGCCWRIRIMPNFFSCFHGVYCLNFPIVSICANTHPTRGQTLLLNTIVTLLSYPIRGCVFFSFLPPKEFKKIPRSQIRLEKGKPYKRFVNGQNLWKWAIQFASFRILNFVSAYTMAVYWQLAFSNKKYFFAN